MTDEIEMPEDRAARAKRLRDERQAHLNLITLFDRLGYDLTDSDEVNRLNENLRFAERQRKRAERIETGRLGWIVTGAIAFFSIVIGAFLTQVIQYWTNLLGWTGTTPKLPGH